MESGLAVAETGKPKAGMGIDTADYRNDGLNMKDTGLIVKRYAYALKQIGRPLPPDTPFQDKLAAVRELAVARYRRAAEALFERCKVVHFDAPAHPTSARR